MEPREAYDQWSAQYDTDVNRTRDSEGAALRRQLGGLAFDHCLEIGCGTGKNTEALLQIARQVTAVDLSPGMLRKAREKIISDRVHFVQADIMTGLDAVQTYDLVVCSLVLEHIGHLQPLFQDIARALRPAGIFYIGELHPFRQYTGSKARFATGDGEQAVACFTHHISDFAGAAKSAGLQLTSIDEVFDDGERQGLPRILTMLFKK